MQDTSAYYMRAIMCLCLHGLQCEILALSRTVQVVLLQLKLSNAKIQNVASRKGTFLPKMRPQLQMTRGRRPI
jgi:hypothetical protein